MRIGLFLLRLAISESVVKRLCRRIRLRRIRKAPWLTFAPI